MQLTLYTQILMFYKLVANIVGNLISNRMDTLACNLKGLILGQIVLQKARDLFVWIGNIRWPSLPLLTGIGQE
jgi:hypothetical protein